MSHRGGSSTGGGGGDDYGRKRYDEDNRRRNRSRSNSNGNSNIARRDRSRNRDRDVRAAPDRERYNPVARGGDGSFSGERSFRRENDSRERYQEANSRQRDRDRSRSRERSVERIKKDAPLPLPSGPLAPTSVPPAPTAVDDFGRDADIPRKEVKLSNRAIEEAEKQERLALVKRLTTGADSDDEDQQKKVMNEDDEDYDVEEDMMAMVGFKGFDTTKGKAVDDNLNGSAAGALSKHKKRVYRQYMNRKGGFNRPLQKIA